MARNAHAEVIAGVKNPVAVRVDQVRPLPSHEHSRIFPGK